MNIIKWIVIIISVLLGIIFFFSIGRLFITIDYSSARFQVWFSIYLIICGILGYYFSKILNRIIFKNILPYSNWNKFPLVEGFMKGDNNIS
jgi:hypothetical protein